MTKEEYLEIKNKEISPEHLFEYYKEKGGTVTIFDEFCSYFLPLMTQEAIVMGQHGPKRITKESAERKFHDFYKYKFNL